MRNRFALECEVKKLRKKEDNKQTKPTEEFQGELSVEEWALLLNVPKKEVSRILGY